MSKNMKIVLIVVGCMVVLCSGVVGIGIYWFSTSGKQMMEQMSQGVKQSAGEGATFGAGKEDNACLKEALSRIQKDESIATTVTVNMFLAGCLGKSNRTPDFCKDVPASREFAKSTQWSVQKCKELGTTTPACGHLMGVVQAHCEARASSDETK